MSSTMETKTASITEIQEIADVCMNILSYTEHFRADAAAKGMYTFAEEIYGSLRKLFIATIMYKKMLICISGLQGAGKTTLMRNFYHLDGAFLDPTRGRGERVPVLITEKDINEPKLCAVRIDKNNNDVYCQTEVELSEEEYIKASKGEDSKIMYLELFVPFSHVGNEGVSFMLLPGFEKKNDYWNGLIDFSVNSSDAAVFVFNETSFSNADNDEHLKRIEEKFGKNLVYVISGSDGSPDDNAEVKQTCIETLNLPSHEADRVVCVGSYSDEEKNNAWIKKFEDALEKYAYRQNQHFRVRGQYLCNVCEEIKKDLYKIAGILNSISSDEITDFTDDPLLKEFDREKKKKRDDLKERIENAFDEACKDSCKKLEDLFVNQSKRGDMKRIFTGNSIKDLKKAREKVEKALVDDFGQYIYVKHYANALQSSITSMENPTEKPYIRRMIETQSDGEHIMLTDSQNNIALVEDVQTLLDESRTRPLQTKEPKKLLRSVVELSTLYYSMCTYDIVVEKPDAYYFEPSVAPKGVTEKAVVGAKASKSFAVGLAGVIGIDLIGDGNINFVNQIAASLKIATPVAAVAAGLIVGAGAVSAISKDVNDMQRQDFYSAKNNICGIYEDLKKNALKSYDSYMQTVRDRIEDNLARLSGNAGKVIAEFNAKVEIQNALKLVDDFVMNYKEDAYGIKSFIF